MDNIYNPPTTRLGCASSATAPPPGRCGRPGRPVIPSSPGAAEAGLAGFPRWCDALHLIEVFARRRPHRRRLRSQRLAGQPVLGVSNRCCSADESRRSAASDHAQALADLEAGSPLQALRAWRHLLLADQAAVEAHLQAAEEPAGRCRLAAAPGGHRPGPVRPTTREPGESEVHRLGSVLRGWGEVALPEVPSRRAAAGAPGAVAAIVSSSNNW